MLHKSLSFCLFFYLAFGGSTDILASSLLPYQGFKILGNGFGNTVPMAASSAGDFNGDGINDIIVTGGGGGGGDIFVIFGTEEGFPNILEAEYLDGTTGFRIQKNSTDGLNGFSVGSCDINGDGIDDIILGNPFANPTNIKMTGAVYVIFGSKQGFPAVVSLQSISNGAGFMITGTSEWDFFGESFSCGDFNGDGIKDIAVADQEMNGEPAEVYVIWGRTTGFDPVIHTQFFPSAQGFKITSATVGDAFGWFMSLGGDVNGDGIDDLIVSTLGFSSLDDSQCGVVYVIFGSKNEFTSFVISDLQPDQGFKIVSRDCLERIGYGVSTTGDINGDGINDIAFRSQTNSAYIIFGRSDGFPETINLQDPFSNDQGFKIVIPNGFYFPSQTDLSGDVNGDGIDDIVLGSTVYSSFGLPSSAVYVIFGNRNQFEREIDANNLSIEQGYRIIGIQELEWVGQSICSTGDINGDGLSDIIFSAITEGLPNRSHPSTYVIYGHKICRDDYLNWDHTCAEHCLPPFIEGILNEHKYCGYPCKAQRYLTWKNTCSCYCNSPHTPRIEADGYKFCDQ